MPVSDSQGGTVRVYRFELYDVVRDEMITSTRMARQDTIERIGAARKGIPFEIPFADVDELGFTAKNYVSVQGA